MSRKNVVELKTAGGGSVRKDDQRNDDGGHKKVRLQVRELEVELLTRQVLVALELRYEYAVAQGGDAEKELAKLQVTRMIFLECMYKLRNCEVPFWICYGTKNDSALDTTTCEFIDCLARLTVSSGWGVINGGAGTGIMGYCSRAVHLAMKEANREVPIAGMLLDFFAGEVLGSINPEQPSRYLTTEYTTPPLPNLMQRQALFHVPKEIKLEVMTWGGAGSMVEMWWTLVINQMRKLTPNNRTHLPGSQLPPFLALDRLTDTGWLYEPTRQHLVNQIAYQTVEDETFGRFALLRVGKPCTYCGSYHGNHKKCTQQSSFKVGPAVYHFPTATEAAEAAFALHASVGRFL